MLAKSFDGAPVRIPEPCQRGADSPRGEILRQSGVAMALGSPFVAQVLAAAFRQLDHAPRLSALIDAWPSDPAASAMALRLNAGLHALARRGGIAALASLYAQQHADFDRAVAAAFNAGEETLLEWMGHPTQTNEVARSGAFMAALMTLGQALGMPFELLEIGASAGLNLLLDRYAHDLGGIRAGTPGSPVMIAPEWRGRHLCPAPVRIVSARGADLRPLPLDDPRTRERLLSYVWAVDRARMERLEKATALARECLPLVEQESAAPWLRRRLGEWQQPGTCRVVLHSMVLQYLPSAERAAVMAAIFHAGSRATPDRPFATIGLEWNAERTEVCLQLTKWTGSPSDEPGTTRQLATSHVYGAWIDWH